MIPLGLMLKIGAAVAGASVIIAAYHFTPLVGPHARLERLEAKRASWESRAWENKRIAEGWRASFRKSEAFRVTESKAAVASVEAVEVQCDARVKAARASAQHIKEIVNAPVKADAAGCLVRPVVGADELRDALQGPASR